MLTLSVPNNPLHQPLARIVQRLRGARRWITDVVLMGLLISDEVRDAKVDAATAKLNEGAGSPTLEIMHSDGTTVLATFTLPADVFGNSAAGTATAAAITGVTATASGTATTWRAKNGDGNVRMSGDTTVTGGGGTMTITNTSINSTDPVDVTAWTYTQPAGSI